MTFQLRNNLKHKFEDKSGYLGMVIGTSIVAFAMVKNREEAMIIIMLV